jgi:3-hydroxyisobutyrate dehydrogenase
MADRTVALLGTGIMGAGMGRSMLREGLAVRAWNRTTEKAEALGDDGATVCTSPEEAVKGAEVIVTMLTNTDAVLDVADQALASAEDGAVWLQMSTIGVEGTDRAAEVAGRHGVTLIDAPVSGTKEPAEGGKLVVLASGPESAREACKPVLDAVGSRTVWLGAEVGKGSRMKMVVNAWLLDMVAALGETVGLAEALGLDPADFLAVIEGGPLDSPYAQLKGKAMISHDYTVSFPLAHARKDAHLALEGAKAGGLSLNLGATTAKIFDKAMTAGYGDEDMAATREVVGQPLED